jgi:Cu+-exporting ATPase
MTDPRSLVQAYLNAFYSGDATTARRLLADDFHFTGPSAHFHSADDFLKAAGHAATGTRSVEIENLFASGAEVAAFYILHLDHRVDRVRVAERLQVEDERITSSTMIMDTGPFLARRAAPADTAIDPVCGMVVDKSSAAGTRDCNGITYFFCSAGCATAFEKAPEKYLQA